VPSARKGALRPARPARHAEPRPQLAFAAAHVAAGGLRPRASKGRAGNVTPIAFSPDSSELLTASGDHQLRVWNTANWEQKYTLTGHNDEVWDARYSPNGQYVVSGGWDNIVRVWSLADHRGTRTIPAHVSDVWATGGGDRKVKFWDVAAGTLVQDVSGDLHMAEVENLAFSPSGQTLVSVSRDGSLKFWRVPLPDDRVAALAGYELKNGPAKVVLRRATNTRSV
jgi:WD40 repeat protein